MQRSIALTCIANVYDTYHGVDRDDIDASGAPADDCTIHTAPFQDIETFDLEDFKYNFVNMTAFRLVSDSFHVREILRQMQQFQPVGHNIVSKAGLIEVSP